MREVNNLRSIQDVPCKPQNIDMQKHFTVSSTIYFLYLKHHSTLRHICVYAFLGKVRNDIDQGIRENLSMNIHYNLVSPPNQLEGNSNQFTCNSAMLPSVISYILPSLSIVETSTDPLSLARKNYLCAVLFSLCLQQVVLHSVLSLKYQECTLR